MLTVTPEAMKKLKKVLPKQKTDSDRALRIIMSNKNSGEMELIFDEKKEGDQVVKSDEGLLLLLIEPNMVNILDRSVLDYTETSSRTGFIISQIPPDK